MKRFFTHLVVIILLFSGTVGFADRSNVGFHYSIELGILSENSFDLFENNVLTEKMFIGSNMYIDVLLKLYFWNFFLSTYGHIEFYPGLFSILPKQSYGISVGIMPCDIIIIELGYSFNDIWQITVPYNYHVGMYHNLYIRTYLRISGNIGNAK